MNYCANMICSCHVGSDIEQVRTPFPTGYGPEFCCNKCARQWLDFDDLNSSLKNQVPDPYEKQRKQAYNLAVSIWLELGKNNSNPIETIEDIILKELIKEK